MSAVRTGVRAYMDATPLLDSLWMQSFVFLLWFECNDLLKINFFRLSYIVMATKVAYTTNAQGISTISHY